MIDYQNADFMRSFITPEIAAIAARGGMNQQDFDWLTQDVNDDKDDLRPLNVLCRADEWLLYPKSIDGVLVFRKVIALLSFFPCGCRLFGFHFDSTIPGYFAIDES